MKPKRPVSGEAIPGGWHAELYDYITSQLLSGDTTIRVKNVGGKYLLHVPKKRGGGSGGEGGAYDGLFAVSNISETIDGVTTLKVRVAAGRVIAGLSSVTVGTVDLTITATAYVSLKLTYADGVYVREVEQSADYPAQADGVYRRLLAVVTVEASAIKSISQNQFGEIHVTGRAV